MQYSESKARHRQMSTSLLVAVVNGGMVKGLAGTDLRPARDRRHDVSARGQQRHHRYNLSARGLARRRRFDSEKACRLWDEVKFALRAFIAAARPLPAAFSGFASRHRPG